MKIERLMTAVAEGLPANEVSKSVSELSVKKQRLEELGSVQIPKRILAEDLHKQARELRERLECTDNMQKKMVLQQFLRGITVHPEKKEILVKIKSPLPQSGMDSQFGHLCGRPLCIATKLTEINAALLVG